MSTCALAEAPTEVVESRPSPRELWKRYHRHGESATENALVEHYLPLVRSVLGRLAMTLPEHVDQDDLHSVGLLGLLQALRHYDPTCGTMFETYARQRIRGAMLDELRRMDWVPRTVHEKARRIQDTMTQLEQRLGRIPTDVEMARALKVSPAEYSELLTEVRPATFVCLDAVCTTESGETSNLCEVIADQTQEGPVERASRQELKEIILARLKKLPDNQRTVLTLYYGEDLRCREIAEVLGVTESRICQIHAQAILSIRAFIQGFEAGTAGSAKRV